MRQYRVAQRVLWAIVVSTLAVITPLTSVSATSLYSSSPAPTSTSPEQDSWTKISSNTLSWSTVTGAVSYTLRYGKVVSACVADTSNTDPAQLGLLTVDDVTTVTTAQPSAQVDDLSDGNWCWQVRANFKLHITRWSEPSLFKVDTKAPIIKVSYPFALPKVSGVIDTIPMRMTFTVDDVVNTGTAITIGDKANSDGMYEWAFMLPGELDNTHQYAVHAVDAAGNETVVSLDATADDGNTKHDLDATEHTINTKVPLISSAQFELVTPPVPVGAPKHADQKVYVDDGSHTASAVQARAEVANNSDQAPKSLWSTDNPIQATNQGWTVFGIAWYWWALGGGMGIGAWALVARGRWGLKF